MKKLLYTFAIFVLFLTFQFGNSYYYSEYKDAKGTTSRNPIIVKDPNDYYKYGKGYRYYDSSDSKNYSSLSNSKSYIDGCEYTEGSYITEYSSEYYTVSKYLDYNTDNCHTQNSYKYCEAKVIKSNSTYYNFYDCYYDRHLGETYCRFPFVKTTKYIKSSKYCNTNYYYQDDYYYDDYYYDNYKTRNCDWGYINIGNSCIKINVPANASIHTSGKYWECNRGYKKDGNSCRKIYVPNNASLNSAGTEWRCNNGYYRSGDICLSINTQYNSYYSNNSRDCDYGYYRSGNYCIRY